MELARNLKVESVCRLLPPGVAGMSGLVCLEPARSVAEAVVLMRRHRVGCVLVCRRSRLVGIFTERDLMRRVLAPGRSLQMPLSACMTAKPVVVEPGESIGTAIRRMEEGGYRHLPVIDSSGQAIGVLSVKRIVHYLVEHFPSTIHCLPPDPSIFPLEPEGA
jgi:CBS domain-containing protein